MHWLRAFIRQHHHLFVVLLVLAFCVKAAIPAGFMLSTSSDRVLTLTICSDSSGVMKTVEMIVPGKASGPAEPAAKSAPCAFSGLSAAALGGADPVLVALAFAIIVVLGLAPARRLPFALSHHLRPPLRGPPAAA